MNKLGKQLLVLPTWAMTNLVNQAMVWANVDHPTRGKYYPLRKWAETSNGLNDDVSFIFWMAWMYTALMVQFL